MQAFLFDLNGTMIHDMDYHAQAWRQVLNEDLGGHFSPAEVKAQMYGKNPEVLERMFGPGRFTAAEMERISMEKERRYQRAYRPHLALLPGLLEFLQQAHARGIGLAIASAAIPFNIDFVLDNLNIRSYFQAIVSADDVTLSKPHPETYLLAAARLGVTPANCLVFEDVPKGAEAAHNAAMPCVVLTTTHEPAEFDYLPNVLHFAADYTDPFVRALL